MHPLGLVLFAILVLGSWYWWQKQPPEQRRSASWKLILIFLVIGLLALAITGRMHWLGALIALTLPFLKQLLPLILRFVPGLARWWQSQQAAKRQNGKGSNQNSGRQRGHKNSMSREEALEVLGLSPNASREEVLAAHRRLMQKIHPDREGSAYLAAQVNAARDTLLDS